MLLLINSIQSTKEDDEDIQIKSPTLNNILKISKLDQIISITLYSINKIINKYNSSTFIEDDNINHLFIGFLSRLNSICISNIKSEELRSYHINNVMLAMIQTGLSIDYILNYSNRCRYRLYELYRFNLTYSYSCDDNNKDNNKENNNNLYLPECCNNNSSINSYLLQCFNLKTWLDSYIDRRNSDNFASIIPWESVNDEQLQATLILDSGHSSDGVNSSDDNNDDDDEMNSTIDKSNIKLYYNKLKKKNFYEWLPTNKCFNKSLSWSITGIAMIAFNILCNASVNDVNVDNDINYISYIYSKEYKCKLFMPYLLTLLRNKLLSSYEGLKYSIAIGKIMTSFHMKDEIDNFNNINKENTSVFLSSNSYYGPYVFISDLLTLMKLDSNSTKNNSNNNIYPLSLFINYYNKSRHNNNSNYSIIPKNSSLCVGLAAANSLDILSIFQGLISKYYLSISLFHSIKTKYILLINIIIIV